MTSSIRQRSVPSIAPTVGTFTRYALRRACRVLEAALRVSVERRCLAALDDRLLKDIGLSRSLAAGETERRFLDVPEHRIRRA
ncbi:MAG: DUF1127 domain-containing protein [Hyphomicrobiaceae bacterium]|nr:DUF1127 domain-containing protein [Hyphomicrobiaceae bacterium]